jgi:hypothetical protein
MNNMRPVMADKSGAQLFTARRPALIFTSLVFELIRVHRRFQIEFRILMQAQRTLR